MAITSRALGRPEHDPALLAFIKCHLTSMARWNILRVLSQEPDYRWSVDDVACQVHASSDATRDALDELAGEGLLERYAGPLGPSYALDGTDPTARVLARLQIEAGRSPVLRQIIVARMLEGRGPATFRPLEDRSN